MAFKIVLKGEEPSGRMLALLCARTGDTIDRVRQSLVSPHGLILKEGLDRDKADAILSSLPADGSVEISVQREVDSWVAVLMGYRPGSRGRLRVALQKMSRLSTEEIIHFLASIPVALKTGIPRKTAESIKDILEREGGIVEIRPHTGIPGMAAASVGDPSSAEPPVEENSGNPDHVVFEPPGSEPDIPPLTAETVAALKPVMNVKPPPVFSFCPPVKEAVSAPPAPHEEEKAGEKPPVPFSFRFTIPARPVPPQVCFVTEDGPPEVTPDAAAVPIYLHPVAHNHRDSVCSVLSEILGISRNRCMQLVEQAPVAIWACKERLNALVTLRGLSERGVPVSLFPGNSEKRETMHERSFFGWMNGNQ